MMSAKQLLRVAGLAGLLLYGGVIEVSSLRAQAAAASAAAAPGILTREQAGAILPGSVFYHGQSASIQARNSSGVRLADGKLVLATLVDTSGYSSGVAEKYQAYLITEVPLRVGDKTLKPGAYGFGFIAGNRMVVMDVGGTEVLQTSTTRDAAMARPTPLKIVADGGNYRLCLGRSYVTFAAPAPGL